MRVGSQMQTRFLYWYVRVEGFQCCPQICVLGVRCRRVSFIGTCVLMVFNAVPSGMRVGSQMQTRFLYWYVRVEGFQ